MDQTKGRMSIFPANFNLNKEDNAYQRILQTCYLKQGFA
jgi:hypothetical protein